MTNSRVIAGLLCFVCTTGAFADENDNPAQIVDSISEVKVTAARIRSNSSHVPLNISVVGNHTLNRQHRTNILPTLNEQIPGLMINGRGVMGYGVSTGGTGGMMMRGISSAAGQVMVLIDGHPQYNGIYGHSIADSYHALGAEKVEVISGPASILYGSNAMGGVINIITRETGENRSPWGTTRINIGGGFYGTLMTDASHQYKNGRFSSNVAVEYNRSDNHLQNMDFEQYGGLANLKYQLCESWNVYGNADITHFNASYPGTVQSPMLEADQWITRGVVNASLSNHFDRLDGALMVYSNFGRHKINDGYGPNANGNQPRANLFRSKDALTGVSFYETAQLFEGNHTTVGADYQHIYGYAYNTSRQDGSVVPTNFKAGTGKSYRNEWAAYVDFRQDLLEWLTVNAGLRYDWQHLSGGELVPQFGIVARPTNGGVLKLTAAKGFRNPSMMELYFYGTNGNVELQAERLWNYELSWQHRIGRFSYKANVFYLKADNLVGTGLKPDGNIGRINTGAFENAGYELQASYRVTPNFSIHANRSYIHQQEGREQTGTPEYVDYLGIRWQLGRFGLNAGTQHVSNLYTGSDLQTFTLVNATASYSLLPTTKLWLRGENLMRQKYEILVGYPMPRATFMVGVNVDF